MSGAILRLIVCAALALCAVADARARSLAARIERVTTAAATLEGVRVALDWPADAPQGTLRLRAARLDAPGPGYHLRDLDWRCSLRRDGRGGWRCDGEVRSGGGAAFRLAVDLGVASTDARLSRGGAAVTLHRDAAAPDLTRIDLARVPLAWAQALLSKAWPAGRLTGGELEGRLAIEAAPAAPLRVGGPLRLRDAALDTPDGTIAAAGLDADLAVEVALAERARATLRGDLRSGELLFGNAYVALQRPVALHVIAKQDAGDAWRLPWISWRDGAALDLEGTALLEGDAGVRELDLRLRSDDLAALREGYLSGWLGVAGLSGLTLQGAATAGLRLGDGGLQALDLVLHDVAVSDPAGRFGFERLAGDLRFSGASPVRSALRWEAGTLHGLQFGAARLPLVSSGGGLRLGEAVAVPMLGGELEFDHFALRPPSGGTGLDARFGMRLRNLDVSRLAAALGWPAFTGELSGEIPEAHYANERLDFEGGLRMRLFEGEVRVSALSMERPFGVAPTLSADVALDGIDLEATTGVFGFGTITGRLDGRIDGLRMVDWQPVAFDAALHTQRTPGVKQRISQRAVQDLSSVGDASFATSLQSRLIGLFDDFGYARIGIACRLADEVCHMDGLGPAGAGFVIVEGAGLPRLTVVGFNRRVDWPTLVERLGAIGAGDVKPVVE